MLVLALAACARDPSPPLPRVAEAAGLTIAAPGTRLVASAAVAADGVATTSAVTVVQDDKPPLEVRARTSDWDLRGRRAVFRDDVVVTRGEVTLRCDTLEVVYGDGQRIDRVTADGNVRVDRAGRAATARHADLDGRTGRIVLTGEPTLREGDSSLVGARIELFLDDERATCTGDDGAPCHLVVPGAALR